VNQPIELKFHIRAFSKATMPMNRLVEYLADLSVILGEKHGVHLDRIEDGSALPVIRVDPESERKVVQNVYRARTNDAPKEVREAKRRMELRLVVDNAPSAELEDHTRGLKLLEFRGRSAFQEPWGPIRQSGELTGWVIGIAGKEDRVTVRLQDGDGPTLTCHAKRDVAKKLRPFLFENKPVRVHGYGKWTRDDQGEWHMEDFLIAGFKPLSSAPLREVLNELRAIGSDWLDGPDPLGELKKREGTSRPGEP
jgi:hypothetical protein